MISRDRRRTPLLAGVLVAIFAMLGTVLAGCGTTSDNEMSMKNMASMSAAAPHTASQAALYTTMRELWAEHMEWTYATVAAFAADSPGLTATMKRLLRNQTDIGNAVKPLYGKKAGHELTRLLKIHINRAVPVLVAAKAGDTASLNKAVKSWYRNAKHLGDFLASANPAWHKASMEKMMKTHITQTIAYASDQLQGKYAKSIRDYNHAEGHMMTMSDMLSHGIIKQFPHRFK